MPSSSTKPWKKSGVWSLAVWTASGRRVLNEFMIRLGCDMFFQDDFNLKASFFDHGHRPGPATVPELWRKKNNVRALAMGTIHEQIVTCRFQVFHLICHHSCMALRSKKPFLYPKPGHANGRQTLVVTQRATGIQMSQTKNKNYCVSLSCSLGIRKVFLP